MRISGAKHFWIWSRYDPATGLTIEDFEFGSRADALAAQEKLDDLGFDFKSSLAT